MKKAVEPFKLTVSLERTVKHKILERNLTKNLTKGVQCTE